MPDNIIELLETKCLVEGSTEEDSLPLQLIECGYRHNVLFDAYKDIIQVIRTIFATNILITVPSKLLTQLIWDSDAIV